MVASFGRLVARRLSSAVGSIRWLCELDGRLLLEMDCLRIKVAKRKFYVESAKVSAERQTKRGVVTLSWVGCVCCDDLRLHNCLLFKFVTKTCLERIEFKKSYKQLCCTLRKTTNRDKSQ